MISVGFPPTGTPLKSVTLAATLATIGGAAPRAVPPPIREPLGQPFGPFDWIALSLHFGKYLPFTTAPFGNRRVVRSSCSGAGAPGSVMLKVVRRESPARALCRSRLSYFPWNETLWVVTATAFWAAMP